MRENSGIFHRLGISSSPPLYTYMYITWQGRWAMSSAKFLKIGSFDWFEFFPFFLLDFLLIISKFLSCNSYNIQPETLQQTTYF